MNLNEKILDLELKIEQLFEDKMTFHDFDLENRKLFVNARAAENEAAIRDALSSDLDLLREYARLKITAMEPL